MRLCLAVGLLLVVWAGIGLTAPVPLGDDAKQRNKRDDGLQSLATSAVQAGDRSSGVTNEGRFVEVMCCQTFESTAICALHGRWKQNQNGRIAERDAFVQDVFAFFRLG
ncbi:unnamed protein product [Protopolystoma xenopodis]|uniref:Uncharacterized protein n=1 Tax=Protopolystoma xenopodis TaxID=117903 RepID=A0A3S5BWJ5_9PLAT|nr:unnamed protein product [Protopolystoma xenopodis]